MSIPFADLLGAPPASVCGDVDGTDCTCARALSIEGMNDRPAPATAAQRAPTISATAPMIGPHIDPKRYASAGATCALAIAPAHAPTIVAIKVTRGGSSVFI